MSANEYMETVTSFSASLLQSLDNDTAAAAEKADLAITDMSANANKMGTSMESIQNAYQGFAKQNFTMLDNLKLGFGGTKEEMQRLLDTASEISGIEYDISSYADIVDAIHIVQTEMGITGTTAKEASSTIQGSVSSMKSAWSNLVTGIATDNADIDVLLDNFLESVETVAGNVLPVVERILSNIFDTLADRGPDMLSAAVKLFLQIMAGALKALPDIVASIPLILDAIIDGFLAGLPDIIEVGKQIVAGLWDGIKSMTSWIGGKVSGFFGGIVDGVRGILDIHSPSGVFKTIGEYMMEGLAIGIENSKGEAMETAADIIDEVKSRFTDLYDALTARQDVDNLDYQLWERTVGAGATDAEKYEKKLEMLTDQQRTQEGVVEAAAAAYEAIIQQYGDSSAESYSYQKTLL